ncbi:MAG: hypothetical protein RJA81_2471 [Planctomycetota bacterium]
MIEPFKSDQELIEEIRTTTSGPNQVALWWLGQSGLLIKSRHATILIDPYLSEYLTRKYEHTDKPHIRMTRCPLSPNSLDFIDYVLGSHRHSDHIDPESFAALAKASPKARFVVPESLVRHVQSIGIASDRITGLEHKTTFQDASRSLQVRGVKAAHETLDTDEDGKFLYLSFVLEIDGVTLFHSGDTMPYDGQAEEIGSPVDLAFLPVNGRDPSRRVAGNMNSAQAVELANQIQARLLVPHHYDMFTFNTVNIREFQQASNWLDSDLRALIPRCGERFFVESQEGITN